MPKQFNESAPQKKIIDFIIGRPRCAVWADMGLGKTASVLTALEFLDLVEPVYPVLVVGPKRVAKSVWRDEVAKWAHTKRRTVSVIVGTAKERTAAVRTKAEIYTINFENIPWLIKGISEKKWPFTTMVVDESRRLHGFRLRSGTRQAFWLQKRAFGNTKRFIELTGTPAPNGLKDLWGQMYFIDKGKRLRSTFDKFKAQWFYQRHIRGPLIANDSAVIEIPKRVSDVAISVRARDYFDLKKPTFVPVWVDLPPRAREEYRQMEKTMVAELHDGTTVTALHAAIKSGKCLQMAAGSVLDEDRIVHDVHDAKYEALDSVISEASGSPVMVAYHNVHERDIILKRYKGARFLDDKDETQKAWNAGEIPVLVFHPKSAGHGLNLQYGGHRMVFLHQDWDLELFMQAIERIGPMRQMQAGFDRPVFIYLILARKTVDGLVMQQREGKANVQELLMNYVSH